MLEGAAEGEGEAEGGGGRGRGRGRGSGYSASHDPGVGTASTDRGRVEPVSYMDDWTDTDTESSVSASNTLLPVLSILTPVSTTELRKNFVYTLHGKGSSYKYD